MAQDTSRLTCSECSEAVYARGLCRKHWKRMRVTGTTKTKNQLKWEEEQQAGGRVCSRCGKFKPFTDYHRRANQRGGYATQCRDCSNEYTAGWHASHGREEQAYRQAIWRNKTPEQLERKREYERQVYQAQPEVYWVRNIRNKYKLTPEQYETLLAAQKGLCAICQQPESATYRGVIKKLHIDHNHKTGEVRGLLCARCNLAVGLLREHPEAVGRLAAYLAAVASEVVSEQLTLP